MSRARKRVSSTSRAPVMDVITRERIDELLQPHQGPCISIYMPRATSLQDPIRLKNLIAGAEASLVAQGLRSSSASQLLAPARHFIREASFQQSPGDGLAMFAAPDLFRSYFLPLRFRESLFVYGRPHITPLLPLLSGNGAFLVLAISENKVRLLRGTRSSIRELEFGQRSLADAIGRESQPVSHQAHGGVQHGKARRTTVFHGQGALADHAKEDLLRFFRSVNEELEQYLSNERIPLVFAGVDYLFPMYREVNTQAHLQAAHIPGNCERLTAQELHERAWAIVGPAFQRPRQKALEEIAELAASHPLNCELKAVVTAAAAGEVDTLLVAKDMQVWGTFDPASTEVQVRGEFQSDAEDLMNLAAIDTLRQGGDVYEVDIELLPKHSPLAAKYRTGQIAKGER